MRQSRRTPVEDIMIIKFVKNNQPAGVGGATKHYSAYRAALGGGSTDVACLEVCIFLSFHEAVRRHFFWPENQVENNEGPRMKR